MLYAPGRAGSLGGSVKAGVRRRTSDLGRQTTDHVGTAALGRPAEQSSAVSRDQVATKALVSPYAVSAGD